VTSVARRRATSPLQERRPSAGAAERRCGWCSELLRTTAQETARFCSQKCRQTAFRLRRRGALETASLTPGRFAYADPPYVGLSARYYRGEASFAGEVDHVELLSLLEERRRRGELLGWALSASARSLRQLLPLCPPEHRVAPWVKPHGPHPATYGLHNCWEALIVVGGRQRRPGVRDWLSALPARGGGTLPGRKPIAFCAWLFKCLGMQPGDQLEDLFPGTGVVTRAWLELSSAAANDGRRPSTGDVAEVLADGRGAGVGDAGRTSPEAFADGRLPAPADGRLLEASATTSRDVVEVLSTAVPNPPSPRRV